VLVRRPLPETALPPGYQRIVFRWDYRERYYSARGEGVARIAPPDSMRLDFFLQNGAAGGSAIVLGDSIFVPGAEARRYLPSPAMLWGALGVVTVSAPDTLVYLEGDMLNAELGRPPSWQLVYSRGRLVALRRIERARIVEALEHPDSQRVVYTQRGRTLRLEIVRRSSETYFDEAIWRR
jgi:hypothetical protein